MAPAKAAATKKRRGRPPGSRKSDIAPAAPSKAASKHSVAKPSTKRKGRPPQDGEDELSAITTSDTQSKRVKRRTQLDLDEIAGETPKSKKKYVQLEERTKRIPVEQLETWPQMSKQLLEHIAAVMQNAKRDIANAQRDERKVITAYEALNPMIRKLERELARARAPLQANDMQFNIDKLTEKNAAVSRDVTTARHSKQQLTDQVKVADQLLRKDEENLEELKRDAKRWSTEWKQQQKRGRIHPLLLASADTMAHGDTPDDIGLRQAKPTSTMLLDEPDQDLAPVLEQLRRSLENLQGNHTQVEGIDEALRDAQTALDDVLYRHATTAQYAAL